MAIDTICNDSAIKQKIEKSHLIKPKLKQKKNVHTLTHVHYVLDHTHIAPTHNFEKAEMPFCRHMSHTVANYDLHAHSCCCCSGAAWSLEHACCCIAELYWSVSVTKCTSTVI